jgi:hypothetical protein
MLIICSVNTVFSGSPPTYTIDLGTNSHPNNYTNQDYMKWVMRDARAANPNIKILIEVAAGANEFTEIFSTDTKLAGVWCEIRNLLPGRAECVSGLSSGRL